MVWQHDAIQLSEQYIHKALAQNIETDGWKVVTPRVQPISYELFWLIPLIANSAWNRILPLCMVASPLFSESSSQNMRWSIWGKQQARIDMTTTCMCRSMGRWTKWLPAVRLQVLYLVHGFEVIQVLMHLADPLLGFYKLLNDFGEMQCLHVHRILALGAGCPREGARSVLHTSSNTTSCAWPLTQQVWKRENPA